MAVLTTPFIILGITSIDLFLGNKEDLGNNAAVMLPFLAMLIAFAALGYGLYHFREKHKLIRWALFVFLMAGPLFLLRGQIMQLPLQFPVKSALVLAILLAAAWYMSTKLSDKKAVSLFSYIFLALFVGQAVTTAYSLGISGITLNKEDSDRQRGTGGSDQERPNVYHIVFDEYQTDMFELTLNEGIKSKLGGFVYYPENTTVFGRTGMSLPTVFTGRSYNFEETQLAYQQGAFTSEDSFLYWLKQAGYKTRALIHKVYTFNLPLFDEVTEHKERAQTEVGRKSYSKTFMDLWLYANLPNTVTRRLVDNRFFEQLEAQNVLPDTAPPLSRASFTGFIQDKEALRAKGTYNFVHLILPHFPYVLRSDCGYREGVNTTPLEQSMCANRLITDFVDSLKALGLYDNSLIIIQGDHGARFKAEGKKLIGLGSDYYSEEWSLARARALLLIKTPGSSAKDQFKVSSAETTLMDIAPTLVEALGLKTRMNMEGISLVGSSAPTERTRYYHFFDKKGKNELTDEMHRYVIGGGEIKFDSVIPVGAGR